MKRLIVTNSDSGSGCLKAARIADKIIWLGHTLASGPAPLTNDPIDFFSACAAEVGSRWEDVDRYIECTQVAAAWQEVADSGTQFDRIEFWIDPDPNAQLQCIQFLDWVKSLPNIASRLTLFHSPLGMGEQDPARIASFTPILQGATDKEFDITTLAWSAYRQPTPEAWFALLSTDTGPLPQLAGTVIRLLQELPAMNTALERTQTELIGVIGDGVCKPARVFGDYMANSQQRVFSYWALGRMLDELANCQTPPVLGLAEGPFRLEMHDDAERYARYKASSLTLSDLGKALVAGTDDLSHHNVIDCWWGGTKLTNDRLWRWDDANRKLVAPQ